MMEMVPLFVVHVVPLMNNNLFHQLQLMHVIIFVHHLLYFICSSYCCSCITNVMAFTIFRIFNAISHIIFIMHIYNYTILPNPINWLQFHRHYACLATINPRICSIQPGSNSQFQRCQRYHVWLSRSIIGWKLRFWREWYVNLR